MIIMIKVTMIFQASLCCFVLIFSTAPTVFSTQLIYRLPNISHVNYDIFKNIGIDRFITLFSVFKDENVTLTISDEPYTIFAPSGNINSQEMAVIQTREHLQQLLLNHIILGSKVDPSNLTDSYYKTLGGQIVHISSKDGKYFANNAGIIESKMVEPNGVFVVIDGYLFLDNPNPPPTVRSVETKNKSVEMPSSIFSLIKKKEQEPNVSHSSNTFMENVLKALFHLKSGVREFRQLLSQSNVSKLIKEDEEYTILVPLDLAFQRWSPIDWGFYPFSVPEFTENIIVNHFIKGNHRYENIRDGEILKSLGGQELIFKKDPTLSVNGVLVLKGETRLEKGNIMFIPELLFVNESIVADLHQQHRDKETPPLLAFPWFGAQFLSHAFLALERDNRFKQITRFLNLADLAPFVSGHDYTFFVPIDSAFADLGLDKMPDNYLSNSEGLQMLLNHFVKGRLYNRDLKDGSELLTLGNKSVSVYRKNDHVIVNNATVIESEVFVYNLGTMYYVDKLLFVNENFLSISTTATTKQIRTTLTSTTTSSSVTKTLTSTTTSSFVMGKGKKEMETTATTKAQDKIEKDTEQTTSKPLFVEVTLPNFDFKTEPDSIIFKSKEENNNATIK